MPENTTTSSHRVCIFILTYKRNVELLQLVHQTRERIGRYRGYDHYAICVDESDPNIPSHSLSPDRLLRQSRQWLR